MRTILPSSSHSWRIASIRSHCENGRQIATSSTICVVEDGLEVVERAEQRPSARSRSSGSSSSKPIDPQAELAVALELRRERLRRAARRRGRARIGGCCRGAGIAPGAADAARARIVTTAWAGNRTSSSARLTSGRRNRNRTLSVTSAMTAVARTIAAASLRIDHRARGRYRPFIVSMATHAAA